ncbi:hypothetical protein [Nocardioides eburneiflavus]|nr:hypothetical protein [Nocardioides eburneiflavus]
MTKYPQAAGSSLYVQKAFGNKELTFLVTVSILSATPGWSWWPRAVAA